MLYKWVIAILLVLLGLWFMIANPNQQPQNMAVAAGILFFAAGWQLLPTGRKQQGQRKEEKN